jgi:hypothetical protein
MTMLKTIPIAVAGLLVCLAIASGADGRIAPAASGPVAAAPAHAAPLAGPAAATPTRTNIPCTGSAPGLPCVFVCYPGLQFAALFVGKGSVSGDCGGASAGCSASRNGACVDISNLVSSLDVGTCDFGANSVGTFACISPVCTACISENERIKSDFVASGHPELADAVAAYLESH